MGQHLSLRTKLMIGTSGIVLLLGLFIIIFVRIELERSLHEELAMRGVSISRHLAQGSADLVLTERIADLQMLINDFRHSEKDVEYIFVRNSHGEIIAHTFHGGFPVELKGANQLVSGTDYKIQPILTERGILLDIAVPLLKDEAGTVHVGLSEKSIRTRLNKIVSAVVGTILVVLLLGAAMVSVFSKRITDPLYELVESAQAVGSGDLTQKVHVSGEDEIAQLGNVFNRMTEDLSKTLVSKAALERSSEFKKTVFNSINEAISIIDVHDFKIIEVNQFFLETYGLKEEDVIGKTCYQITHGRPDPCMPPDDPCPMLDTLSTGTYGSAEHVHYDKEGEKIYAEIVTAPVKDERGKVQQVIHILRDVTERKVAEEALRVSEEKYTKLFHHSNDGIFLHDLEGNIIEVNQKAAEMLGYTKAEILSLNVADLHPAEEAPISKRAFETVSRNGYVNFEIRFKRKHGDLFPADVSASLFEVSGKKVIQALVRDITQRKLAEKQIIDLAYYDSLTGLPNRTLYKELLARGVGYAQRYKRIMATLFIDLDSFKRINDTLGHTSGDKLLQAVAERLLKHVRQSDCVARSDREGITNAVSRLGGDEFIVLLNEINRPEDAALVARRILNDLAQPFTLEGREVYISGSIGIAICPMDGDSVESLLKNADLAMYHAKAQGKNNYQFYTPSMNTAALKRLTMENDLRRAQERKEFLLFYQPKIDVQSGIVVGMEALLRWKHPEHGLVLPADFIPLAEETGLIVPIGEWVLRTACLQTRALHEAGFRSMRVAVNLSNRQFAQQDLAETIERILNHENLDPRFLELEITESIIIQSPQKTLNTLQDLKIMGIQFAIDDFGTGYSSLDVLKRLPVDSLKIDRSFVMNIYENPRDAAIVKSIIALAHSLELSAVAEGVEAGEALAFLRDLGCDEAQGYQISRPLPIEEFLSFLKKRCRRNFPSKPAIICS